MGDHVFLKVMPKRGSDQIQQAAKTIAEDYLTFRDTQKGGYSFISISVTTEFIKFP